ncbi:Acetyltransferase (GNAT) domain-containing protein [Anaerovirgula multivorans]|uniref:Acetyltransferase (GNAT) domain-containing protein n=1 Tax=Anaerovirgula multivorans TaxID=312168 RepID=A0A238ZYZ8_9FIRM|nr:GNAT family N-acetyltransferase [Anaerovirgula multivorans]SNR88489.1 Acetyltransferase (GNAT) domain-containing protein [Anaerovirgula multivorans]
MITVRKILRDEIEALVDFYQDNVFYEEDSNQEFIVAFDNNQFLGFTQIDIGQHIAEIINIYVNENERGQGLGDGLLRATLNYLEKNGYLWTLVQDNIQLNGFLRKEGFVLLREASISTAIMDAIKDYDSNSTYYCNIPLFFKKGCKNNKN